MRAPNNYVFPADDLVVTVAQWYQKYSSSEYRDMYIVIPRSVQRKGKGNLKLPAFSVELYINVGQVCLLVLHRYLKIYEHTQYTARTEDPELVGVGRAGSKRKTSATRAAHNHNHGVNGSRGRSSTCALALRYTELHRPLEVLVPPPPRKILRSSFVRDGDLFKQTPQALSVTEVRFKKTTCLITDDSGTPTLLEESSVVTGFLETRMLELSACERGSTKDVFAVCQMILV